MFCCTVGGHGSKRGESDGLVYYERADTALLRALPSRENQLQILDQALRDDQIPNQWVSFLSF